MTDRRELFLNIAEATAKHREEGLAHLHAAIQAFGDMAPELKAVAVHQEERLRQDQWIMKRLKAELLKSAMEAP